jgi:putative alpha-1,2-mannosidase
VDSFEKRQPVAVSLGISYDTWCLAQLAKEMKKTDDACLDLKKAKEMGLKEAITKSNNLCP